MVTVSFSGLEHVKYQQGWTWKELVGLTVQTTRGEFITDNVSHEILQIALRLFQFNCSAHSIITKDYTEEKRVECACICVYVEGGRIGKEKNKHLISLVLLFYIPVPYNKKIWSLEVV